MLIVFKLQKGLGRHKIEILSSDDQVKKEYDKQVEEDDDDDMIRD